MSVFRDSIIFIQSINALLCKNIRIITSLIGSLDIFANVIDGMVQTSFWILKHLTFRKVNLVLVKCTKYTLETAKVIRKSLCP